MLGYLAEVCRLVLMDYPLEVAVLAYLPVAEDSLEVVGLAYLPAAEYFPEVAQAGCPFLVVEVWA